MTPRRSGESSSAEDRIFDEAARWFSKSRAGLSARDSAAFLAWLKAAPENAAAMDLVTAAWAESEAAARSATLRPEMLRAQSFQLADMSRPRPRRGRQAWVPRLAGLGMASVACIALAGLAWSAATTDARYTTVRGDGLTVALRDGSRLQLGSATAVHVHIDPLRRNAQIEGGEASFEIAHEGRRPFHVAVRDIEVRDLGTRFTVRDRTGPVRVVLIEGRVELLTAGPGQARPTLLAPGQQALVDSAGVSVSGANLASALAWRDGRIILRDVSLKDALLQWEGETPVEIDLGDPALAALRISGVYRTSDVVAFLNGLTRVHPVRWQEIAPGHYRLRPAQRRPRA